MDDVLISLDAKPLLDNLLCGCSRLRMRRSNPLKESHTYKCTKEEEEQQTQVCKTNPSFDVSESRLPTSAIGFEYVISIKQVTYM